MDLEQSNADLEKEIEKWKSQDSIYVNDIDDCARHFYNCGAAQTVNAAVEGWVARDLDGSLWFHYHKPHLENELEQTWWGSSDNSFRLYEPIHPGFENVTFEGGPIKTKLIIVKEEEK